MDASENAMAYWKYEQSLFDKYVQKLLALGNGPWKDASVVAKKEKEKINKEIRVTDVIWKNEQWIYDLFWPFMVHANESAGWNLEISCAENFQLGRYKKGGHYDFHIDGLGFGKKVDPGGILDGTTRKLSMVCWLNEDFEGGEFEFHHSSIGKEDNIIKPTKGTIVFFPSWVAHKVHPVTKGTRYSLVTWFRGQPVT